MENDTKLAEALRFYAEATFSEIDDDLWWDEDGNCRPGRRAREALGLPVGSPPENEG